MVILQEVENGLKVKVILKFLETENASTVEWMLVLLYVGTAQTSKAMMN
jgi:hypothetical protein